MYKFSFKWTTHSNFDTFLDLKVHFSTKSVKFKAQDIDHLNQTKFIIEFL